MVLRGGEPGGCLTGFWMHFPETRHFGDECVRAHVEYYNATDVDILKVMNEHPYTVSYTHLDVYKRQLGGFLCIVTEMGRSVWQILSSRLA